MAIKTTEIVQPAFPLPACSQCSKPLVDSCSSAVMKVKTAASGFKEIELHFCSSECWNTWAKDHRMEGVCIDD